MATAFILTLATLTSLGAVLAGARGLGLRPGTLGAALIRGAELVGAALLFWLANVALGMTLTLVARNVGLGFVSLYLNTDVSILIVSCVQGLVFECWRQGAARPRA